MLSVVWRNRISTKWCTFALAVASAVGSLACGEPQDGAPASELTLAAIVTLHGVGDSIDLAAQPPVVAANGYIVAARILPPSGGLALFDSGGRYLRSIGRAGRGPGEFGRVGAYGFGPGDTLWVADGLLAVHAFGPPPAMAYVRTLRFERFCAGTVTSSGMLCSALMDVGSATVPAPRLIGWDGKELERYGTEQPKPQSDNLLGPVVLLDRHAVWRAHAYAYVLERLTSDGRVAQRRERTLDWFPPDSAPHGMPWLVRPIPRITSIALLGPDTMAVLIHRARADWAPTGQITTLRSGPVSPGNLPHVNWAGSYETTMEIVDLRSGSAVATRELGGEYRGLIPGGRVYSVEESESGAVTIRLWKLLLSR